MGNNASSSSARERHKSGDSMPPCSPGKLDGHAFTFDKKPLNKIQIAQQHSHEDDAPYFTKPSPALSHPQVKHKLLYYLILFNI
jgi:hypothetical protein